MKRLAPKMLGFAIILFVGIFVGIEWTQSGIERVHGPMTAVDMETSKQVNEGMETDALIGKPDAPYTEIGAASSRPEEIWIDIDKQPVRYVPAEQQEEAAHEEEIEDERENQQKYLLPPAQDAPVNQLADKAAGLLQQLSETGIKAVVGMFGGLF